MEQLKQAATMATLDLASSFANGDRPLPRDTQALLFLLKKDVSEHRQRPKPHNGRSTHQLIVVQAQFLLAIAEEDLDVPACRDMREQCLWIRFQVAGGPVPCLRERGVQRVAHDNHLAAIELAYRGDHDMDLHPLSTARSKQGHIVWLTQLEQIVHA